MLHPKQHIADLSEICFQYGLKFIVISPGSRNAPLIEAFYAKFKDRCVSIVDERSAAYFALGLARELSYPVALVCTSGTAVLNYGPALAEAYYAAVPLLVITADRPSEWIDQQDNQTIRQKDVYRNFVIQSFNLPEVVNTEEELEDVHQLIKNAIEKTWQTFKGPVHLNVPLHEPLYDILPSATYDIIFSPTTINNETSLPEDFISDFRGSRKIFIIHGMDPNGSLLNESFSLLSHSDSITLIAENLSNINSEDIIANPELMLMHTGMKFPAEPELVIYSGGQITSKRLKSYLRSLKSVKTWRIGCDAYEMDTFKQNNRYIKANAKDVYREIAGLKHGLDSDFHHDCMVEYKKILATRDALLTQITFSDLQIFQFIHKSLLENFIIELGNSTPVRYSQFFDTISGVKYIGNRGVSGIDGCLSSAVGTAFASGRITLAVLGDLSFVYDSNALWNRRLPANLRIVVINNHGGGIFSLLEGPRLKPTFENYVEASHPVVIQKLAEAFNLDYFYASDYKSLSETFPDFMRDAEKARIMEIFTNRENNNKAYDLVTGRPVVITY